MTAIQTERIIGRYTGQKRGPLVVAFGGLHGNEPAGIRALEMVFRMLKLEPRHNPGFTFRGRLVGIAGNLPALARGDRYLEKDLNRQFTPEHVARVRAPPYQQLTGEDRELRTLMELVYEEIDDYQPRELIVLDLHTTTADGGIFVIATDDPRSLTLARRMYAPVITGMLNGIAGTTLHYFNDQNLPLPTVAVTFEGGQHDDLLSVRRCIAATINLLRSAGMVRPQDVENRHDDLLLNYSKNLPHIADLIRVHRITPQDEFRMEPGYRNFQPVKAGELLAHDRHGPIYAEQDCRILMPLYQARGDDGFFLIREVENGVTF
ncbi:MAG: succinylglutamate desuccinylase/aspartoacylase family protein [Lewinella sp.]|nr:succinylglutamate desuccinylase/aspartoacylase family protein [Lewinella sp.]